MIGAIVLIVVLAVLVAVAVWAAGDETTGKAGNTHGGSGPEFHGGGHGG